MLISTSIFKLEQELTSRSATARHPSVPLSYGRRLRRKPKFATALDLGITTLLQSKATREGGDIMVIIERVAEAMPFPSLHLLPLYDEHLIGVQGHYGCQERRQPSCHFLLSLSLVLIVSRFITWGKSQEATRLWPRSFPMSFQPGGPEST